MANRVSGGGVLVEQVPDQERRVSSAGILVEQTQSSENRRVETAALMVEQKPTPDNRRVAFFGLIVEYTDAPPQEVEVSSIDTEEALGEPSVSAGSSYPKSISVSGMATQEAVGQPSLVVVSYDNFDQYIYINGLAYRAVHKTWSPTIIRPVSSRNTLLGALDGTFSNLVVYEWEGELACPVTPEVGEGGIEDLETILSSRQTVTIIDQWSNTYTDAQLIGPFPKRSAVQVWDQEDNVVYVQIRIRATR